MFRLVTTLVAPNGAVAATPAACAKVVTAHWAEVSKVPATTLAARQEVLAAVAQAGMPALGAQVVQVLGAAAVTEQEVWKALRHSRPGTAPGGDGIPVQLYQKFKDQFAPLLARVFTAIGVVGREPLCTNLPLAGRSCQLAGVSRVCITAANLRCRSAASTAATLWTSSCRTPRPSILRSGRL